MPSKNKDIDGANESVKKVNEVEKNKNAKDIRIFLCLLC